MAVVRGDQYGGEDRSSDGEAGADEERAVKAFGQRHRGAVDAGVTRQAITKLVDELERLDLVRRDPDPDDGRGVIVRYTDRGRVVLAIARKRMLALERGYAARVGADRWADVRSTLETLFGDHPHEHLSLPDAPDPSDRKRPDRNQARTTGE